MAGGAPAGADLIRLVVVAPRTPFSPRWFLPKHCSSGNCNAHHGLCLRAGTPITRRHSFSTAATAAIARQSRARGNVHAPRRAASLAPVTSAAPKTHNADCRLPMWSPRNRRPPVPCCTRVHRGAARDAQESHAAARWGKPPPALETHTTAPTPRSCAASATPLRHHNGSGASSKRAGRVVHGLLAQHTQQAAGTHSPLAKAPFCAQI
jgi:hypothetical protein